MLVYHLFWNQKGKRSPKLNSAIFIVLCCLVAILCITFAAKTIYGFQFDMRHIVLIVGTLTGGPIAGGSILVVLNIYRFLLGGIGVFPSLIGSILLFIVLLFTYKFFNRTSNRIKITLAIIYSLIYGFSWIPFFLSKVTNKADYIPHIIVYELCTILGTILILYLLHILQTQVRLQNELMNAEKFHLIGEMAASISHEIRNPLTSTKGFLQLLQSDICTEQERKLYIDIAINGIEQANHVLTDYLTFAKPSIEKEQRLQLEEELLHALSLITPLANLTNVRTHYIKQSTSFFIAGEKQKLNQCLLNILKNCIEAMPKGGDLYFTLVPDHKHIQLYIKDTGVGMDQEQVKRLGSPFYSTKEKGTGLGMMVVFSVVQAMNGKIDIISEKGTGTTFLLTFPLIQKT
ncbi:TPA: sporulation sensor histidine kinase KinB [Bacillus anthracis]|uniref:sporulation sensor histidine kinase KinB n=1 Tax=Bacillus anthracis TaxID=1392 RepID=UPI0001711C4A|nr:sporulation sensor histidine kinase KinB [Bacillus anthracis]AJH38374.1 5TMR of 5TMR-LYT family protein [Bacillus anthracis]EDT20024.1 sporulation kinase B [Bacillus anthracis str. A0465]HDR3995161.1 sporulation sensor histidine kinase KinB [Bacillus anthracis]HDR4018627.1 sporulation sensor histidine kinase KinB [Bacillus anthracis]HDR4030441.1 sporulation sensor histidine kinase KinB [Bacillus anthracis]